MEGGYDEAEFKGLCLVLLKAFNFFCLGLEQKKDVKEQT